MATIFITVNLEKEIWMNFFLTKYYLSSGYYQVKPIKDRIASILKRSCYTLISLTSLSLILFVTLDS